MNFSSCILYSCLMGVVLAATHIPCTAADHRDAFMPAALTDIKLVEHLNETLPLNLQFTDDSGKAIRLQECFTEEVPVILSLNYSNCPMLCVLQLNGLVDSLREIDLVAGKDFQIVSVSLDPQETAEQARATKQKYLESYGKAAEPKGWHFLTGPENSISQLAKAVGIEYVYLPEKKQYSHPAVFCIATPDGRLSRYHYGVEFPPQTVRLSLVEASEGKIGTTFDHFLLICFHYDATEGRYAPTARNIMKIGGAMAILVLGLIIWTCHRFRRKLENVDPDHSLSNGRAAVIPGT